MNIDVGVIDRIADADRLAPEWDALRARAAVRSPMQSPVWALSWWRIFGGIGGRRLRLVTMRAQGGALVGLAPLVHRVALHRGALPVRRIELLGTGEDEADEVCSEYVGILAAAEYETRVAEAFASSLRRGDLGAWDALSLTAMNGEDPAIRALARALGRAGGEATLAPFGSCSYITLPRTWEEYLQSLEGPNRYLIVRTLRDLEKWVGHDGITLTRASDSRGLEEGKRLLHALHSERWASRGVFGSERFSRFHDLVMPKLLADPRQRLDLTWLSARGRPIAIGYYVTFEDRVLFYQSGRALDVPKGVRPGIALHALAIRRAIEEGRREYDFLGGDAQYKKQLSTGTRPLVTLRAIAPSARARLVDKARARIERAAEIWRASRARRESGPAAEAR